MKKMRNLAMLAIMGFAGLMPFGGSSAQAATLLVDGTGELYGATGVLVNSVLYDVEFKDGSFNSLYVTPGIPLLFTTLADANAASQALLDQVIIDGPDGNFDSQPELTRGIEYPQGGVIFTPYMVGTPNVASSQAANYPGLGDGVNGLSIDPNFNLTSVSVYTYAIWSVHQVAEIPEPSTYMLLGSCLGIVAFSRAKKRAQQKA